MVRIKILAERNVGRTYMLFFLLFFFPKDNRCEQGTYATVQNWRLHKSADYSFRIVGTVNKRI